MKQRAFIFVHSISSFMHIYQMEVAIYCLCCTITKNNCYDNFKCVYLKMCIFCSLRQIFPIVFVRIRSNFQRMIIRLLYMFRATFAIFWFFFILHLVYLRARSSPILTIFLIFCENFCSIYRKHLSSLLMSSIRCNIRRTN